MLFVTIYVDDFLIFTNDDKLKRRLKKFLHKRFRMKDLGETAFCLGLRITRDRTNGKLWIDQEVYINNVFNMVNSDSICDSIW